MSKEQPILFLILFLILLLICKVTFANEIDTIKPQKELIIHTNFGTNNTGHLNESASPLVFSGSFYGFDIALKMSGKKGYTHIYEAGGNFAPKITSGIEGDKTYENCYFGSLNYYLLAHPQSWQGKSYKHSIGGLFKNTGFLKIHENIVTDIYIYDIISSIGLAYRFDYDYYMKKNRLNFQVGLDIPIFNSFVKNGYSHYADAFSTPANLPAFDTGILTTYNKAFRIGYHISTAWYFNENSAMGMRYIFDGMKFYGSDVNSAWIMSSFNFYLIIGLN